MEGGFMIHGHSDVAKLSRDIPSVSVTAESVLGKSKKSRKKNRWQPYHVVAARTFCKFITEENWQPYTSKKRLRSSSGCHERMPDTRITDLPDELIVKVLSNLDVKDISGCRLVNRKWHALVDKRHLQALAFARFLHYQPAPQPQTVENYRLSTRSWLRDFGIRGKELAEQLDELLEHKHFREILFFAIAEVLAKTRLLTCQSVYTFDHSDWVNDASFSPDGSHVATVSWDKTVSIWELVAGQWQKKVIIAHSEIVSTARFSPDGRYFLTAAGHTAQIWELVAGQWQQKITIPHSGFVINASFSPDGHHLVITFANHTAQVWELVAGQCQQKTTIQHFGLVNRASFSPDGRHLVTASMDHTVKIWERIAGQWQQKTTIWHSGPVINASFSPDGSLLVTASSDHTAQIWEHVAERWQKKATIQHVDWLITASFSPDGSHLVTASDDFTLQIWGRFAGQWQEKATISLTHKVNQARFSPDGSQLVTASSDKTAKVWLLKSRENNDIS